MKGIKRILEIVLALIALFVFVGLVNKGNMWLYICIYWCVLTIKNINDVVITHRKDKDKLESN